MSKTFEPRIVESLLRREAGTVITFDDCERWPAGRYHFKPGLMVDGRHAAEITEEEHYERFLSLPEGFRPVHPGDLLTLPKAPTLSAPAKAPTVPPTVPPASTQDGEGDNQNDDVWDANKVLALGVNKIMALVKTFDTAQLTQLLEIESGRADSRESLTKQLAAALRARTP